MREVEALHVDDADQHALAVVMPRGAVDTTLCLGGRARPSIGDDGRRGLERLRHFQIRDVLVRRDRRELAQRHLRLDDAALAA